MVVAEPDSTQRTVWHTVDESLFRPDEAACSNKDISYSFLLFDRFNTDVSYTVTASCQQQSHTVEAADFPVSLCDIEHPPFGY